MNLLNLGRLLIIGVWGYGFLRIFKHRHLPHANQVLVAALAMVLSSSFLVFNVPVDMDVLVFFMAMAQLVVVISFMQLFKRLSTTQSLTIVETTKEHLIMMVGMGGASLLSMGSHLLGH